MRIQIERAPLLRALSAVKGVVETRHTIPILANVRIDANSAGVTLTATDLEIASVITIPATVGEPGACTAPAATLHDIVRRLPADAVVTLVHDGGDGMLSLRAGRYATSLNALPVDDFPAMTTGTLPHSFAVPAAELRAMIDRTSFAMSREETRAYLNGLYFCVVDGNFRIVSTDGHRLAQVQIPCPDGAAAMPAVIVPRKAVHEVSKMLDGQGGDVTVSVSETRIQVAVGGVSLTSKLIEGSYPETDRVIPRANKNILSVQKAAISAAVARVSTIGDGSSSPVRLAVTASTLTVSASNPDRGTATEDVDAEYRGAEMVIGFNAKYLSEIIDQVGDIAEFRFGTADGPAMIVDPADDTALSVLMPMRC